MPGPAGPAPQPSIGRTAPEAGPHVPGWEEPGRFKAAVTGGGGVRRSLPPPLRRQWRSAASPRAPRAGRAAAATCEGREASPPSRPGARPARRRPGRRAVCRSPLLTQICFHNSRCLERFGGAHRNPRSLSGAHLAETLRLIRPAGKRSARRQSTGFGVRVCEPGRSVSGTTGRTGKMLRWRLLEASAGRGRCSDAA